MTDYKRLTFAISLILLVFVLVIPACAGEEPPSTDVMAMGGSLTIDSKTPASGTIITAKSGDEVLGTASIEAGGIFGDKPWNGLYIKEPSDADKITLYAELETGSVVIAEGIDWSSGDVQYNIKAFTTDSTNGGDRSSGSGGSSSYTIIDSTDDGDEAVAGAEGVESDTPISAHTITPTTESTPTTGETGSPSKTVIIVAIIIIVAVIAFVIYQKSKY
jgi:hypothetical protein